MELKKETSSRMSWVPINLQIVFASIVTLNLEMAEYKSRIKYAFHGT